VDDGLATGMTMRAAIVAVRRQKPARLVVAVPVIAWEVCDAFRALADVLVWVIAPAPFMAVGLWYEDFTPTTDAEVCDLLARAAAELPTSPEIPPACDKGEEGMEMATSPGAAQGDLALLTIRDSEVRI
jgi:predicted phosphoribosyltransferase